MPTEDTIILGPCAVEPDSYIKICRLLVKELGLNSDWVYKGSFDKANRTSVNGARGIGLEPSISLFKEVKNEFPEILLTTDVHEVWQLDRLVDTIDIIQIPAFLCKQTDLIVEATKLFDVVNIKKGQWIGPETLSIMIDKIKSIRPETQAWITDRGSSFGYEKLINDFSIVDELKSAYDKVILDCTHSTQRSRKLYKTQGCPQLSMRHFLAASIYNYDGIFAETHVDPKTSPSDGECMIEIGKIKDLLILREQVQLVLGNERWC